MKDPFRHGCLSEAFFCLMKNMVSTGVQLLTPTRAKVGDDSSNPRSFVITSQKHETCRSCMHAYRTLENRDNCLLQ